MGRQLSKEEILNAKEVYLYSEDVIYVELEDDDVYGLCKGGLEWYKKESFYDYLESQQMMSFFSNITKETAINMINEWKKD